MSIIVDIAPERIPVLAAAVTITRTECKATDYARSYALVLCTMIRDGEPDNAIHMQCLYVLNNIQHWRGDVAKSARVALKAFVNAK